MICPKARKETVSLDGEWRFLADPYGTGSDGGLWRKEYDDSGWGVAPVPGCYEAGSENLEFYKGICWYRRSFSVPNEWAGKRVVLHFESVNDHARVWLDGELIGENHDPFLSFEFDITGKVDAGGDYVVAVETDNSHHEGAVPGRNTGWRRFGGILREVSLHATPLCHISRVQVQAKPGRAGGEAQFTLRIKNASVEGRSVSPFVLVRDADGRDLSTLAAEPVSIGPGAEEVVQTAGFVEGVQPWSPESPTTYRAIVSLAADEDGRHGGRPSSDVEGRALSRPIDEVEVAFGFRTIEATPDGLLLNGEPIWLQGWNRHEDSPRTGGAADHEMARQDLLEMKEAGANMVRLCHYPHHPGTLDMCDELGLLVFAEIPLYFWRQGYEDEGARAQPERAAAAARQLERMIVRDFNHPSVICWSVSNETDTKREDVRRDNEELIRRARKLDSTRLCVHVSNKPDIACYFDEDDVVCINRYPCRGLTFDDLAESADTWRDDIAGIREKYPDKPVLATEFGYVSLAGTKGMPHGEDAHARALEAQFDVLKEIPCCCGTVIWCWADHAWPNRVTGSWMGNLMVSPYGVVTRDRRKLDPYHAARKMFCEEEGSGL